MSGFGSENGKGLQFFLPMGLLQSRKSEVKIKRSPPDQPPAFAI
jgi:hypothetical protein